MNINYYQLLDELLTLLLKHKRSPTEKDFEEINIEFEYKWRESITPEDEISLMNILIKDGFVTDKENKLTFEGIRFIVSGGYTAQAKREKQKEILFKIGQWAAGVTGLYYLLEILSKQLPFILSHFCCCFFR